MKKFYFFIYQKKFLIIYIIIGFFSILFELFLRNVFIKLNLNELIFNYLPIVFGILFAFYFNIRFNFSVPKIYLKRSLLYFFIISIMSFAIQKIAKNFFILEFLDYNYQRVIYSGVLFLIGYFFHTTFTFKKIIKVGVAIYANGYEELMKIKNKIGDYPDFIHVDIVDETMKKNADFIDFSKLEEINSFWSKKEIHTHIMSKKPKYIIDKVLKFSKIIYVHYEIDEKIEDIKEYISKNSVIPGIVLHSKLDYPNLDHVISGFTEVMILSIDKPGYSGQKFNDKTFELIKRIDQRKDRKNFNLLVDGGVNSKLIKKIDCEKIVSGAAVLKSEKPIIEIMKLQTVSRYEIT
tara:strand:- start:1595 stop:2641 length:1047 start_codon:yes stop_codon:yes gene_type:complete